MPQSLWRGDSPAKHQQDQQLVGTSTQMMSTKVSSVRGSPANSYPLISWTVNSWTYSRLCLSWVFNRFKVNACFGVFLAALACVVACLCTFGLAGGVVIAFISSSTALCAFASTLVVSGFMAGCAMVSWCVIVGVWAGVGACMLAFCGLGMFAWAYVRAGGGVFARLRGCVKFCMGPGVSVASMAYSCVRASLGLMLACSWIVTSSLSWVIGCTCVCLRVCIPARLFRASV